MEKTINRNDLLGLVKNAKTRIRILGAVAFNLPFIDYQKDWLEKINKGKLQVEIICESESSLNYSSLISTDKRISGQSRSYDIGSFMNIKNAPLQKIRDYLLSNNCKHIEPEEDSKEKQCFSLRTSYLPIPVPVINIDNDYYIGLALTAFCDLNKFEKISEGHHWWEEYKPYFDVYFDVPLGAKKYSTEITKKDNKTEVIVMYNDQRHILGQLPRDSFLETSKVKVVVWGMIFSRDGRVLIHQRGSNAKDNRGLWDKSIGGHVDLEKDTVDTTRAAAREMLEELYKVETEGQGNHTKSENFVVNEDKPIFLGDWRSEIRYSIPFSEIRNKQEEIFFFRVNYGFSKRPVDSPRILPDGTEMPVKCCADVYIFVMENGFEKKINKLKNSKYKLLELHELRDCYQCKKIIHGTGDDETSTPFEPTPDLTKIITGELWTNLTSFADYLKEGMK